jgi:hypothetical protein
MQSWVHITVLMIVALVGLAAAIGLMFLLVAQFSRLTRLRLRSLSLFDLWVLARSANDRAEVIKEFYDWQHKLLLAVITGLVGFIAANVVLVVQATVGNAEATKAVAPFLTAPVVGAVFGVILLFLLLLALSLLARLGRIPEEYRASINLYERMR